MKKLPENFLNWCLTPESSRIILGERLASYFFTPEARFQANVPVPFFPSRRGSVLGIFIWNTDNWESRHFQVLSKGFILPFEWKYGQVDDNRLPCGLTELATQTREITKMDGWGLSLADELNGLDLSALHFDADSLAAPLAAGLMLAHRNGLPQTHILSTGCWVNGFIHKVDNVPQKIETIMMHYHELAPAGQQIAFFVPRENFFEQKSNANHPHLDIMDYPFSSDISRIFETQLKMLHAPPQRTDSFADRLNYGNAPYIKSDIRWRRNYYLENLVDDLADNLGKSYLKHHGRVDALLMSLSKSPEIATLIWKALHPKQCLVLYTKETETMYHTFRSLGGGIDGKELMLGEEEHLLDFCITWLRSIKGSAVVDITSGTKCMTALSIVAAQQTESRIVYLDHLVSDDQRPDFGTESLRELEWIITRCKGQTNGNR